MAEKIANAKEAREYHELYLSPYSDNRCPPRSLYYKEYLKDPSLSYANNKLVRKCDLFKPTSTDTKKFIIKVLFSNMHELTWYSFSILLKNSSSGYIYDLGSGGNPSVGSSREYSISCSSDIVNGGNGNISIYGIRVNDTTYSGWTVKIDYRNSPTTTSVPAYYFVSNGAIMYINIQ